VNNIIKNFLGSITTVFQEFLKGFGQKYSENFNLIIMDNGRFHKALLLDWDDHVMPIYLPAYSPELNPIERLWEHTKKDLKWENYSSLDQLKEQVNRIIKSLTNEEVLSLCGWDYILEAILINQVNERMVEKMRELTPVKPEKKKDSDAKNESPNRGKLIIDATCAPADITYPTDLGLLNKARVHTEKIIDILYKQLKGQIPKKPRTYRNLARKDYLAVAKKRQPTRKKRRQALKKQLQYIKRNLANIEQLIDSGATLEGLNKKQYKTLLVLTEVYRQQQWLFNNNKQSIEDRIVSLSQPHIRPIVRGKAGKSVEFGAKLSASCFEGYVFLDRMSWDNFNESGDLKAQVEAYHRFTGYYPESVHADRIYRTRENRAWCKEKGIRISGPPLGRPPANVSKSKKRQALEDERIRNAIEGKFGQGKRRFGLNRV
jgi:transposase